MRNPLETTTTNRGFAIASFRDEYGNQCSIQKSSDASQDAIWLGINAVRPLVLKPGEGWQEVPLPEGTQTSGRMHLNREQVGALLPLLQRFVETGELTGYDAPGIAVLCEADHSYTIDAKPAPGVTGIIKEAGRGFIDRTVIGLGQVSSFEADNLEAYALALAILRAQLEKYQKHG